MFLQEAAAEICSAIPVLPRDSLRFFGEWFGGRRDNIHTITGATASNDALVVHFDEDETLTVWNPSGIVATATIFPIEDAARLRWEWFYYGRPHLPENLQHIEYIRTPGCGVSLVDTSSPPATHRPDVSAPVGCLTRMLRRDF